MNASPSIPLIDLDQFLNGSIEDRKDVVSKMDAAFRSVGFIYLSNHGIDESRIDECFLWVSRPFLSPYLKSFLLCLSPLPSFYHRLPFSTT